MSTSKIAPMKNSLSIPTAVSAPLPSRSVYMPKLIKDGAIVEDSWTLLAKPEGEAASVEVPAGQVIVPLGVWLTQKARLQARQDIGVWLDSDETASQLGDDARALPLVAVNFPVFMDGRSFSTARLLRERYGFTGELRAVGNFI